MKRYEYGVTLRPPTMGNVPGGHLGTREDDCYNFGVVQYPKPLPTADVQHYDLVPLDPNDPVNLRRARDVFQALVLDEFSDQDIFVVENSRRRAVLTWSTRPDVEWQVTHFDGDTPTGHDDFTDFDRVVQFLFGFMSGEERRSLSEAAIPCQTGKRSRNRACELRPKRASNPAVSSADLVKRLKF